MMESHQTVKLDNETLNKQAFQPPTEFSKLLGVELNAFIAHFFFPMAQLTGREKKIPFGYNSTSRKRTLWSGELLKEKLLLVNKCLTY